MDKLRLIYEGSKSHVFLDLSDPEGRTAIKMLKNPDPSPQQLSYLRNELLVTKALDIEGVRKVYREDMVEDRPALYIEYVYGDPLRKIMVKNRQPMQDMLEVAVRVTEVLDQIHRAGIIHRDVTSNNIIAYQEGDTWKIKFIDFAFANWLKKLSEQPEGIEGTLAYIAPEQTGRTGHKLDFRADLYALGVTLYEMFCGRLPFPQQDFSELIHAHLAQEPPAPESLNPEIPRQLSRILLSLLAKNPDQRYQSAGGLLQDLRRCLKDWASEGEISEFNLSLNDASGNFELPGELFGREAEIGILQQGYDRIALGGTELLIIKGQSGMGKSALAASLRSYVNERGGYFAQGSFDRMQSNVPYQGTNLAFRELVNQLLTESGARMEQWKQKIQKEIGENGRLLTEVLPDLELIIGEQPPISDVSGATESQNRLLNTFLGFMKAIAAPDHPLVIFLDDCQWADSDSMGLVQVLLGSHSIPYLWVIATLREHDSQAKPAFLEMVQQLEEQDSRVETLELGNLPPQTVTQLIAASLQGSQKSCRQLGEVIYAKTQGNPFFVRQMLLSIYEGGLLRYSQAKKGWTWDLPAIQQLNITDNVVELMADKIQRLPGLTQEVLKKAACIGNQFALSTLQAIHDLPPDKMIGELNRCIQEGLVADLTDPSLPTDLYYGFTHDRIRQAVYSLIPKEDTPAIHLRIGKLLHERYAEKAQAGKLQEHIFDLVGQWNRGEALIESREDKRILARLNLIAGRRSNHSAAYHTALGYLRKGLDLLAAYGWESNYQLNYELSSEALRAAFLNADYPLLKTISDRIINQTVNLVEKVEAYELRIQALIAQNQLEEATEQGLHFLEQLGVTFPSKTSKLSQFWLRIKTRWLFQGRSPEDLLLLPPMEDPLKLAALRIISSIIPAVQITQPELSPFLPFAQARLSIRHGNAPISATAYVGMGIIYSLRLQKHERGYAFGQLGLKLLDKFENEAYKARTQFLFYSFLAPITQSLKNSLKPLRETYELGKRIGDIAHAGFAITQYLYFSLLSGKNLLELEEAVLRYKQEAEKREQKRALSLLNIYHQVILNLLHPGPEPYLLDGKATREAEAISYAEIQNNRAMLFAIFFHKTVLAYLFEDYEKALSLCTRLHEYRDERDLFSHGLICFYEALSILALYPEATSSWQKEKMRRLEDLIDELDQVAAFSPANHLHRLFLVEAEKSRVLGLEDEARKLYEKALQLARYHEYPNDEALCWELSGKFYRQLGNAFLAEAYLVKAWRIYHKWGAEAKVAYLENRFPHFIGKNRRSGNSLSSTQSASSGDTIHGLDLESITKASIALSGEVVLSNLLEKMMHIVMENAGAERGAFIEEQNGRLLLIAHGSVSEQIKVREAIPVEKSQEVAASIVNFVARTRKEVVLRKASEHPRFGQDAYIQKAQSRSVLCYPLIHKRKLTGLIYLENNLTEGAFTTDRIEVLNILSSQICISIDNARLYEHLDEKVRARTAELNRKNNQLAATLVKLKSAQSKLVESEKMASLGQLTAGIAHEINNPVNFISGNIGPLTRDVEDIRELLLKVKSLETTDNLRESLREIQEFREEIDADYLFEEIELLLKGIKDGASRTKNIVLGLKNFSRLDEHDFKVTDIHEGIDSTLALLKSAFKDRISIHKDYQQNLPRIECLPGKLNQVFMNILSNAIDAIKGEGEISIMTRQVQDQLQISIKDSGQGMSKEVSDHIFEPFFTTKEVGEGTGLGLSIVYGIIQQHHGKIEVQSEPGKGSEFLITLPMQQLSRREGEDE